MINDSPHQKEALKKALSGLPAADQTATATFHLAPSASPAETEQLVKNVTTRVSNELGRGPAKVKAFPNISTFVVEADPQLLLRLAEQEEVKGGSVVRKPAQSQPSLIRPIRKYPDNPEGWVRPASDPKKKSSRSSR